MALSSPLHRKLERGLYEFCCEEVKAQYESMDYERKERLLNAMQHVFINKIALGRWGKKLPRDEQIGRHSFELMEQESRRSLLHFSTDTHFADNYSSVSKSSDFCNFEKIFIRDLKLFGKSFGKFLEGVIITLPLVLTGITSFLEDARGDIVQLGLYNMIPNCEEKITIAKKKFPVGLKIKIAQPYYKIFADGNYGIRVDFPEEICVVSQTDSNIDEIIQKGKMFIELEDYLAAFDIYFAGFANVPDMALLLNNRCQTEIKLKQYELALLDAAAVLFIDRNSEKARFRYEKAAKELGFAIGDTTKIHSLWERVLSCDRSTTVIKLDGSYAREDGNTSYKEGNYCKAQSIYTAVLRGFDNACMLLTGIGFVCLKTEMYQTAISAASACLQTAWKDRHLKQARFIMTTAFSMLGELELAKLSANDDPSLSHLHDRSRDTYSIAERVLSKNYSTFKEAAEANMDLKFPSDYVKSDAIEHCYISGKGRGLKAKRNIHKGELLIIDHPVISHKKNPGSHLFFLYANDNSESMHKSDQIDLGSKLIALMKYDGLLAKKLLLLDARQDETRKAHLPLISDLEMMAYRKLSHDLLPFLPQTPAEVGINTNILTPAFIRDVCITNAFGWGLTDNEMLHGCALALRMSLLNHDDDPNCVVFPLGNALVLMGGGNIRKGEELTIVYNPDKDKLAQWGL